MIDRGRCVPWIPTPVIELADDEKFSGFILDRFHPSSTARPFLIIFICGICESSQSIAQVEDLITRDDTTSLFFSRKTTLTYGIALHSALAIVLEYKWWWQNDYHPFEAEDEGFLNDYSLGVDTTNPQLCG